MKATKFSVKRTRQANRSIFRHIWSVRTLQESRSLRLTPIMSHPAYGSVLPTPRRTSTFRSAVSIRPLPSIFEIP